MATVYSDGFALARSGRKAAPSVDGSRGQVLRWDFASLPAGNIGDILVCGILRKGSVVLDGFEFHSAMGGTATGAYGTYAIGPDGQSLGAVITVAKFLAATSHVAAGQNALVGTLALGALVEETADVFLCITNAASAFATAGRLAGFLRYLRD